MPAIFLTGIPCSGKSTRVEELKNYFESNTDKKVIVISEEETVIKSLFDKNTYFSDSKKEKLVRADIKSHVQRTLNPANILIVDASNYIKGYRYELYCMTKQYKNPQCTIQTDLPAEHAWLWNEQRPENERYTRDIFNALILRYEPPDSRNRWDEPLFIVHPEDKLPFSEIYSSLFNVNAPKPNMSTQCPPLSTTNYLYHIDQITQEIVNELLSAKQLGIESNIKISKYNIVAESSGNAAQLTKLRRQFLTYSKMQQLDTSQIPTLFVQYLNKSL